MKPTSPPPATPSTKWDRLLALLIALQTLVTYWFLAMPTVGMIDSGELTTVATSLGVAHPTGYPLWTLLAHLFTLTGSAYRGLILFCALCSAGTVGFLILAVMTALRRMYPQARSTARLAPGLLVGLALSFSYSFALEGVAVEVYALTYLCIAIVLYLWCRLFGLGTKLTGRREFWLGFFILALAMGNHASTVFFLLAWTLWAFWEIGRPAFNPRPILTALVLAALGGTIYLVLPIRAGFDPVMNWGGTNTWDGFWRHVTGWQYRVWMFTADPIVLAGRLKTFAGLAWENLLVLLPLSLLGFIPLWRRPRFLVTSLLAGVAVVGYTINYDIPDIDQYYVPAFLIILLWAGIGLGWLAQRIGRWGPAIPVILLHVFLVWGGKTLYAKANVSHETAGESLGRVTLDSANPNAVVLLKLWDPYSAGKYLQFVKGYRKDVLFLDQELMRRSWYVRMLQRRYLSRFPDAGPAFEAFLAAVGPFEAGTPYDGQTIEGAYRRMILTVLESASRTQPVLIGFSQDTWLFEGHPPQPQGVLLRWSGPPLPGQDPLLAMDLTGIVGKHAFRDPHSEYALQTLGTIGATNCYAALRQGDEALAKQWMDWLHRWWPDAPSTRQLEQTLGMSFGESEK